MFLCLALLVPLPVCCTRTELLGAQAACRHKSPSNRRRDSARIAAWISWKSTAPSGPANFTTSRLSDGLQLALSTLLAPPGLGTWSPPTRALPLPSKAAARHPSPPPGPGTWSSPSRALPLPSQAAARLTSGDTSADSAVDTVADVVTDLSANTTADAVADTAADESAGTVTDEDFDLAPLVTDNSAPSWDLQVAATLDSYVEAVRHSSGRLGRQLQRLATAGSSWSRRPRSLFPLPPPGDVLWRRCSSGRVLDATVRASLFKLVLVATAALNSLHAEADVGELGPPTVAQSAAIANIANKVLHMWDRLVSLGKRTGRVAGGVWTGTGDDAIQPLQANLVDTPITAAACDPLPRLPAEWQGIVTSSSVMFPHAHPRLRHFGDLRGRQRSEYVKLVTEQLRAGKLALASEICGGGTVFGRMKANGKRMRVIWHGSAVSKCAARPPLPPCLASPSCFSMQELAAGERLHVSKRDAQCYFDQLLLPECLQQYMAQPAVTRAELVSAGLADSDIEASLRSDACTRDDRWWPVSRVWCMGFSWSSAVGQQVLLDVCRDAGLGPATVLAPDCDIPASLDLQHAVATDDVMIFSRLPGRTDAAAARLDTALADANIVRNPDKDVNDVHNATCLGIDLVDGSFWDAPAARTLAAIEDIVALTRKPRTTPLAMAEFMGGLQWYDLLCRPKLSCYDSVYDFMRLEPQREHTAVPPMVIDELLTSVALTAWWSVPLHREFAPLLLATDASTGFGFGGCVLDASVAQARTISRVCAQSGESVALEHNAADSTPQPAARPAFKLGARKADFKTVFSIRAKRKAHINLLETSALNLGLEWMLRNPRRHHKRVTILLDSRVVIGGAAKGRSSSKPLLRELRRTAALVLAGSLQPYYVHIGTKDNPADEPSRGVRHRSRELRCLRKWRQQRANDVRQYQRCVDRGVSHDDLCLLFGHLAELSSDGEPNFDTGSSSSA